MSRDTWEVIQGAAVVMVLCWIYLTGALAIFFGFAALLS